MANPSKPGWRRAAGQQPAAEAPGGKVWKNRKTSAADKTVASHRLKLSVLGALVVLLVAALIYAILNWPQATPLVVMGITEYQAPIPPNGYALEDVDLLTELFKGTNRIGSSWNRRGNIVLAEPACEPAVTGKQLVDYLRERLSHATPGGPGKDVVLIYLSAHGVLNGAGDPCLLLSDASPADQATWLKMKDVLDEFGKAPQKRKVLLLDAGRIDDAWSLGVLYNGFFAERLKKLLDEANVPRLYVLNSTHIGQRSWSAPELGGSVFGHFACRGLQGQAAGGSRKFTLLNLVEYVKREVSAHVRTQRAGEQLPWLMTPLEKKDDFDVAYATGVVAPDLFAAKRADKKKIGERWTGIHDRWRQLEELTTSHQWIHRDPVAVAQVQNQLLRLEELLLAGRAYVKEFETTDQSVAGLLNVGGRAGPPINVFSMPLQRQLSTVQAADAPAAAVLANWQKARGKPPLKKDEPEPTLSYAAAADVGWRFLLDSQQPRLVDLHHVLDDLIDRSGGRRSANSAPLPDLTEVLFLRMLRQYLDIPGNPADFTNRDFNNLQRTGIREALRARDLAEKAAAPADERVHYWLQPLVNSGDQSRRLAEDLLFCDQSSSSPGTAQKAYQQAIDLGNELGRTLELRDTVGNALPYLAAWVLRGGDEQRLAVPIEQLAKYVETLAVGNRELAGLLDRGLVSGKQDAAPAIQKAEKEVRPAWEALSKSFVSYCRELRDRVNSDSQTLREIGAVLRVPSPLLAAKVRVELVEVFLNSLAPIEISVASTSQRSAGVEAASSDEASGTALPPALEAFFKLRDRQHPAVELLNRSRFTMLKNVRQAELTRGDKSNAEWLAHQGEHLRQTLASLDATSTELEDDTKNRLKQAAETDANTRVGVSEADQLFRAAAAMAPGDLMRKPADALWKVDRHLQMLWHARRAIDDFWGPSPGKDSGTTSYFDLVATAYLQAAKQFEPTPTRWMYRDVDLDALLGERRLAWTGTGLKPEGVDTLGDKQDVSQSTNITWHKNLTAPGTAALYFDAQRPGGQRELVQVKDAGDEKKTWRRKPLEVAGSAALDSAQRIPLRGGNTSGTPQSMAANLFYRGHHKSRQVGVRVPRLVLPSTSEPQPPPWARVTVGGEGDRKAFISFILDCSGSMKAIDGPGRPTRMAEAKSALSQVLNSLPLGQNYNVGLRAYAHRFRYEDGTYKVVLGRNGPAPQNPGPDRDAEVVVPIDQLNGNHRTTIETELRRLSQWGNTPLYYSILQALNDNQDFARAGRDDLRHIIVITDGADETYVHQTPAASVLEYIRQNPGKLVDVVIFNEQDVLRQAELRLREFPNAKPLAQVKQDLVDIVRIATQTGGRKFSANDPEQLVKAMRDALKLFEFSVMPIDQADGPAKDLKRLEQFKEFDFQTDRRGTYRVKAIGVPGAPFKDIELKGGESIRLEYEKAGNRLVFPRYKPRADRPQGREIIVEDPTDSASRYRVTPILPIKDVGQVEFRWAIQHVDPAVFTYRPDHVWAEITPLDSGKQPMRDASVFYDAEFVQDEPVPVLKFVIEEWPGGATWAATRLWFKFARPQVTPNGTAPIQSLQRVAIAEDMAGADFTAEIKQISERDYKWQLTVDERHELDSGLFTARVQTLPPADQINHTYYLGVGQARHLFKFKDQPGPTVVITSKERVLASALEVPEDILPIR